MINDFIRQLSALSARHRLSKCAPMIAVIGLSSLVAGSTSTAKVSSVTAPIRYKESFGPNTTGLVTVSFNSCRVISASPKSRLSCLPSTSVNSRVREGSIPIPCKRSSGMNVYKDPVSTQNSSSKKSLGSEGFVTFALTLNMPIFFASISSFFKGNLAANGCEVNRCEWRIEPGAKRSRDAMLSVLSAMRFRRRTP